MASEPRESLKVADELEVYVRRAHDKIDAPAEALSAEAQSISSSDPLTRKPASPSEKGKAKESDAPDARTDALQDILKLVDTLLILEDAFDGIKTRATDRELIRDATCAFDIDKRLPRNHSRFQTSQMLCRCLTRLASVYYAVEKKLHNKPDLAAIITSELKDHAFAMMQQHLTLLNPQNELSKLDIDFDKNEKIFNLGLVKALQKAELLTGIDTLKDTEQLLFHCKNLYSVLRPARTIVTVTKASREGGQSLYLRTVHRPITQKTPEQKAALKELQDVGGALGDMGKTLHRSMPIAMQEISALFYEKLIANDTMLPAQARKFIAHTVKNAWDVVETISEENPLKAPKASPAKNLEGEDCVLRYRRSGSPVPTAKIPQQELQDSGRENLLQIQHAAAKPGQMPTLCVFNLMTRINYEHQQQVIDVERALVGDKKTTEGSVLQDIILVVVPTAFHAKRHAPIVSESAQKMFGIQPPLLPNLTMASAIEMVSDAAVKVLQKGIEEGDTHLLIHCASGQDRTHTAIIRLLGDWFGAYLHQQFTKTSLGFKDTSSESYEQAFVRLFILGNVGPFLNSVLVPGAPGLKSDSMDESIIPLSRGALKKAVLQQLYLEAAGRNKQNAPAKEAHDVLLSKGETRQAFQARIGNKLKEVQHQALSNTLQPIWKKLCEATNEAATWRLSLSERKALADVAYRMVHLLKPFENKNGLKPEDLNRIAQELSCIGSYFRKAFYRPAVRVFGLTVMLIGLALAVMAIAALSMAFIPGSPLILALGLSASLLAKISLLGMVASLIPIGIGAGVFAGEKSQRYENFFSTTLATQSQDIKSPNPLSVDPSNSEVHQEPHKPQ